MHDLESVKRRLGIVGRAPKLNYALKTAMRVASTDITVLITGESGSGKESFSKLIHALSPRRHHLFTAINCGAIPEGTIDSELFGHEKGAFTGAHESRKGYFEASDKGTLFLDEVSEMPLGTQARLLRVLENGEFIKVGASRVQKTDVRLIAATNKDLMDHVERKKFREDLYYRLNTVPIRVPPLRERAEDIELLYKQFANDMADTYKSDPIALTEEALQVLMTYPFPGNVRELKNVIERMSILELKRLIDVEILQSYLPDRRQASALAPFKGKDISEKELLYKILFDMRKDVNDLKALVSRLLHSSGAKEMPLPPSLDAARQRLLAGRETEDAPMSNKPTPYSADDDADDAEALMSAHHEEMDTKDISHEEESDLSLNALAKDTIQRVLAKHDGKRKAAAEELGISERTLYRKIKQYELDKLL